MRYLLVLVVCLRISTSAKSSRTCSSHHLSCVLDGDREKQLQVVCRTPGGDGEQLVVNASLISHVFIDGQQCGAGNITDALQLITVQFEQLAALTVCCSNIVSDKERQVPNDNRQMVIDKFDLRVCSCGNLDSPLDRTPSQQPSGVSEQPSCVSWGLMIGLSFCFTAAIFLLCFIACGCAIYRKRIAEGTEKSDKITLCETGRYSRGISVPASVASDQTHHGSIVMLMKLVFEKTQDDDKIPTLKQNVFIYYHDDDTAWVQEVLCKFIETELRMTMKSKDDLKLGSINLEEIIISIRESEFVILVLSEKYMDDRQCKEPTLYAYALCPHAVIPIGLNLSPEVLGGHPLYYGLTRINGLLQWNEKAEDQEVFWVSLRQRFTLLRQRIPVLPTRVTGLEVKVLEVVASKHEYQIKELSSLLASPKCDPNGRGKPYKSSSDRAQVQTNWGDKLDEVLAYHDEFIKGLQQEALKEAENGNTSSLAPIWENNNTNVASLDTIIMIPEVPVIRSLSYGSYVPDPEMKESQVSTADQETSLGTKQLPACQPTCLPFPTMSEIFKHASALIEPYLEGDNVTFGPLIAGRGEGFSCQACCVDVGSSDEARERLLDILVTCPFTMSSRNVAFAFITATGECGFTDNEDRSTKDRTHGRVLMDLLTKEGCSRNIAVSLACNAPLAQHCGCFSEDYPYPNEPVRRAVSETETLHLFNTWNRK